MFNERRVLVTGGGGLVGRHLIKLLLESGAHVTAISHTRSPPSHLSEKIELEVFEKNQK